MAKPKPPQHLAPQIIGLKVKKDHLFIHWVDVVVMPDGSSTKNVGRMEFRHEPHPELVAAINDITPHVAFLGDQEPGGGYETLTDEDFAKLLEKYALRSVKITDKPGEFRGVSLGGYRRLASKKVLNMSCALVKFQQGSETYEWADHLEELVDKLVTEVQAYLGGKYAEPGQMTLGFASAAEKKKKGEDGEEDEDGEGEGKQD